MGDNMIFIYFGLIGPYAIGCKVIERGLLLYTASTAGDDTSHCGHLQRKREECVCVWDINSLSSKLFQPSSFSSLSNYKLSSLLLEKERTQENDCANRDLSQGQTEDTYSQGPGFNHMKGHNGLHQLRVLKLEQTYVLPNFGLPLYPG